MFIPDGSESVLRILAHSSRIIALLGVGVVIALSRAGFLGARYSKLQSKGMELQLSGKLLDAERCFRAALALGKKVPESDRVRLLVCLGDVLIDEERYLEARQCIEQALEIGDFSGSAQGSLCDILLALNASPDKVIEMADQAKQRTTSTFDTLPFGSRWNALCKVLYEAMTWARKAQAMFLLDRQEEANQAIDRALSIVDASKSEQQLAKPETSQQVRLILGARLLRMRELTIVSVYWRLGLSLLAMGNRVKAIEQFRIVRDTDQHMGKYRMFAEKKLSSLS
ncbi:MAG: tetratricopeptide repeat protein [Terracidiphilus sp.]